MRVDLFSIIDIFLFDNKSNSIYIEVLFVTFLFMSKEDTKLVKDFTELVEDIGEREYEPETEATTIVDALNVQLEALKALIAKQPVA